jgi:hypothetical protein
MLSAFITPISLKIVYCSYCAYSYNQYINQQLPLTKKTHLLKLLMEYHAQGLPEGGTKMPKHVGVLIIVVNCIILRTFVVW